MLAFKRALSITLSVLMMTPTVTWAKSPQQRAPARQVAKSASSKMAVQRQARMPASNSKKKQGTVTYPLRVAKGVVYEVSEVPGRFGRVISRTTTGPGFSEMIVDKNEDGFIDVIEVTRGKVTTTASAPFRGKFRRMDVEHRMKNGVYKAKLYLSPDEKAYEIISEKVHQYGKFGADIAGAQPAGFWAETGTIEELTEEQKQRGAAELDMYLTIDRWGKQQDEAKRVQSTPTGPPPVESNDSRTNKCESPIVINSLEALDAALRKAIRDTNNTWTMEQVLQCQLNKFQPLIMDRTCMTDPRWAESRAHLNWGLARVMASHYEAPMGARPGRYLQCLTNQGWGDASARVNQFVWQRFRNVSTALMEAGLTAEDFAQLFSQVQEPCTLPNEIRGPVSGRTVNMTEIAERLARSNAPPTIACSPTQSNTRRAEFDNGTIRVFSTAGNIAMDTPFCRGRNCDGPDAYAATFFHELIHASGFGHRHESIVENAERCCSVSTASPDNRDPSACSATQASARFAATIQMNTAVMSTLAPGFNDYSAELERRFAPNGGAMLEEYGGVLANSVRANADQFSEAIRACESRPQDERSSCHLAAFENTNRQIRRDTEVFFTQRCPLYARLASAADGGGLGGANDQTCRDASARILGMLENAENGDRMSVGFQYATIMIDDSAWQRELDERIRIDVAELSTMVPRIEISTPTPTPAPRRTLGQILFGRRSQTSTAAAVPRSTPPGGIPQTGTRPASTGPSEVTSSAATGESPTVTYVDGVRYEDGVVADPVVIEAIRVKPITVEELGPLPRIEYYEQPAAQPAQQTPAASSRMTAVQPQQQRTQQPTTTTSTQIQRTAPTTTTTRTQTTTPTGASTRMTSTTPTSSESAGSQSQFSSGLSAPSNSLGGATTTNAAGQTLGSTNLRSDGVQARQLPGDIYAGPAANAIGSAVSAVARVGQTVVNATTSEARAAEARIAQQNARSAPRAAAASAQPAPPAPPAGAAALGGTQNTIILAGSPVAERGVNVSRSPAGENRVIAASAQPTGDRVRAGSREREREREGSRERDRDGGAASASRSSRTAAAASAPARSGDGQLDEAEQPSDERPSGQRAERAPRAVASAPGSASGESARGGSRSRSNIYEIQDATGMVVELGRRSPTEVRTLLRNKRFRDKLKAIGLAVIDENGVPRGDSGSAQRLELCANQQRYRAEGTCR